MHPTARPDLRLRPASSADRERLFAWRNDLVSRANSRSSDPLDASEHAAWFERTLAASDRMIFIAEVADAESPVGMVRADAAAEGGSPWTLSWIIAPEHRGRGLLAPMLARALETTRAPARAIIRRGNEASERGAARVGFTLVRTEDGFGEWTFEPGTPA